jgi:hypothetical protein
MAWRRGRLQKFVLSGPPGKQARLRIGGEPVDVVLDAQGRYRHGP